MWSQGGSIISQSTGYAAIKLIWRPKVQALFCGKAGKASKGVVGREPGGGELLLLTEKGVWRQGLFAFRGLSSVLIAIEGLGRHRTDTVAGVEALWVGAGGGGIGESRRRCCVEISDAASLERRMHQQRLQRTIQLGRALL